MNKILSMFIFLFTLVYSTGAFGMPKIVSSDLLSKTVLHDSKIPIEIRIPAGNIVIEKGKKDIKIDYYFEYNYEGKDLSEEAIKKIYAGCSLNFSNGILTSDCKKPSKGWINPYYHITIPEGMSLAIYTKTSNLKITRTSFKDVNIDINTGNLSISNVNIHGALTLVMHSGKIDFQDVNINSQADIQVSSGKADFAECEFKSGANINIKTGKLTYKYNPIKTGTIVYKLLTRNSKSNIAKDSKCQIEDDKLICNKNLPTTNLTLRSGTLKITQ